MSKGFDAWMHLAGPALMTEQSWVKEPLDNQRSGRVPGLDLSLMNSSNTDQASISLISPLWKLNLAHLGRFFAPDEHTKPPIMSCIATHAAP